jgi:hypothetical protein
MSFVYLIGYVYLIEKAHRENKQLENKNKNHVYVITRYRYESSKVNRSLDQIHHVYYSYN